MTIGQLHIAARKRLTDRHCYLLEKIIKQHKHIPKFWILGRAKSKRTHGRTTIKADLKPYFVQPEIQPESYLYEVDNTLGTKKLVWVMHPDNVLHIPEIGKSICVAGDPGVNNLAAEVKGD